MIHHGHGSLPPAPKVDPMHEFPHKPINGAVNKQHRHTRNKVVDTDEKSDGYSV